MRRIEAITGRAACAYATEMARTVQELSHKLKTRSEELVAQIDKFMSERKSMQEQLRSFAEFRDQADAQKLLMSVQEIGKFHVVVGKANVDSMDELRNIADLTCEKLDCGIVVLGAVIDDKVSLVVKADKTAVKLGAHAGNIIKAAAKTVGGGGGGRPDMAQAGGKDPEQLPQALEEAVAVIRQQTSV